VSRSALWCVAILRSGLGDGARTTHLLVCLYVAVLCSLLQCVLVFCNVSQCVAVCCCVLQ